MTAPEPGFWSGLAATAAGLFATIMSFVLLDYRGRVQKVETETTLLKVAVEVLTVRIETLIKDRDDADKLILQQLAILVGEVKAP